MTLEQYNEDGAFSCESLIILYYGYFVSITLKDINDILKEKAFDIYFSKEEAELLTPNSFEQILESNNDIIILMDALDEISKDIRKKLINLKEA